MKKIWKRFKETKELKLTRNYDVERNKVKKITRLHDIKNLREKDG